MRGQTEDYYSDGRIEERRRACWCTLKRNKGGAQGGAKAGIPSLENRLSVAEATLEQRPLGPVLDQQVVMTTAATLSMGSVTAVPAAPYSTADKASFAYISAKDRWPVIVVSHPLLYQYQG